MRAHAEKKAMNSKGVQAGASEKTTRSRESSPPEDRSDPMVRLQDSINSRPQVQQLQAIQNRADPVRPVERLSDIEESGGHDLQEARPQVANRTGLPDVLKEGVEALANVSLDGVKLHKNSDKPAQLRAAAYAEGTDIYLGRGQERHLAHETWHVAQQIQGRVTPTTNVNGVAINDDAKLEKEADVMGAKAAALSHVETAAPGPPSRQLGGAVQASSASVGARGSLPTAGESVAQRNPLMNSQSLSRFARLAQQSGTQARFMSGGSSGAEKERLRQLWLTMQANPRESGIPGIDLAVKSPSPFEISPLVSSVDPPDGMLASLRQRLFRSSVQTIFSQPGTGQFLETQGSLSPSGEHMNFERAFATSQFPRRIEGLPTVAAGRLQMMANLGVDPETLKTAKIKDVQNIETLIRSFKTFGTSGAGPIPVERSDELIFPSVRRSLDAVDLGVQGATLTRGEGDSVPFQQLIEAEANRVERVEGSEFASARMEMLLKMLEAQGIPPTALIEPGFDIYLELMKSASE